MRLISGLHRVIACVGVCVLSACGISDGGSVVSGRVLDANQAAVANAEVIAVDRLSGREFNAKSQADGSYRMVLPEGHYDLGAEDAKLYSAHMVMLHTLRGSDTKVNFALPSDQPQAQLSGRVLVSEGVPAANYRLVFSSNHGRNDDAKLDMETTTDAQGNFTVSLGVQRLLDVDIYDTNNNFVEFVVLHKLDGALRADITLGDASDNKAHRHHEPTEADIAARNRLANGLAIAEVGDSKPFKLVIQDNNLRLTGGLLPFGSYLQLDQEAPMQYWDKGLQKIVNSPAWVNINNPWDFNQVINSHFFNFFTLKDRLDSRSLNVYVGSGGWSGLWWYPYSINFYVGFAPLQWNTVYKFTDDTGDIYKIWVFTSEWHSISYRSDRPSIREIKMPTCLFKTQPKPWQPCSPPDNPSSDGS